ncbi:MAG: aminotransferase class IV family protein, partial [Deltaproteobacteria bacterium]|nr:aminotransferase class IV family protein [Deltaproteobacteria bacterium]
MPTIELTFPYWDDVGGTIRGHRVFTACRTVDGRIFRLEDHLDRLYRSATGIFMTPPMPKEELRPLLEETVRRNRQVHPGVDLLINVVFSGGLEGCTMKKSSGTAHLYIAVQELMPPPPVYYEEGVALATFPHQRIYPDLKLLNYVGAIVAHQTVIPQHKAYEVLFVCPVDRQTILEGSTFTIFFVDSSGEIVTPPLDGRILDSITRRALVELLASGKSVRLKEVAIRIEQIPSF